MENASVSNDDWNNISTTSCEDKLPQYQPTIRDVVRKVLYIIIGSVGVSDNLFVIIVCALYINITNKVSPSTGILLFFSYSLLEDHHQILRAVGHGFELPGYNYILHELSFVSRIVCLSIPNSTHIYIMCWTTGTVLSERFMNCM